ncbi:hypothetical protein DPMN_040257 [Dreissena polymorpha]|uniref:Uncharacterized protein n=1 Tax=Dreissena polymorpha TaxID=45954 RepID=A0A9D4HUU6_DREPO|nr:hypothetical protein DPMN_040257 [Dreissena polymorpha]
MFQCDRQTDRQSANSKSPPVSQKKWIRNKIDKQTCFSTDQNNFKTWLRKSTYFFSKFYEDWTYVTPTVFTRKTTRSPWRPCQDINRTNLLTKFHKDCTINVASRVFTR